MDYSPYFVFFNDTATPQIYTLSLPAAVPISQVTQRRVAVERGEGGEGGEGEEGGEGAPAASADAEGDGE